MAGCNRQLGRASVALFALLLGCLASQPRCDAASAVQQINRQSMDRLWGELAYSAAEATLQAVQRSAGLDLTLRDVHMDSFKVFVGRKVTIGLEVGPEGKELEISLQHEADPAAATEQVGPGRVWEGSHRQRATGSRPLMLLLHLPLCLL